MNVAVHNFFPRDFLKASELEASSSAHVNPIKSVKSTLKDDFNREFGSEAFNQYYLGKVKTEIHEDYEYHGSGEDMEIVAKAPEIALRTFDIHFPHEAIADELGVNFVKLHAQKFKPYYMAAAMHQLTNDPLYDELAGDLLEEIEQALKENIREGHDPVTGKEYGPLSQSEINFIINALSESIDCMVAHRKPDSLRMADLLPKDREIEPPPEHLLP